MVNYPTDNNNNNHEYNLSNTLLRYIKTRSIVSLATPDGVKRITTSPTYRYIIKNATNMPKVINPTDTILVISTIYNSTTIKIYKQN